MILQFKDNTSIEVITIIGRQRLTMGAMRDTLMIEIKPSKYSFEELKACFQNPDKTMKMYIHESENNEFPSNELVGYSMFVSISDEIRDVHNISGKMEAPITEEVYIVTMCQLTYAEFALQHENV